MSKVTPTQKAILIAALAGREKQFEMLRGDRKGTRTVWQEDCQYFGVIAYQSPEYFMVQKGWIESVRCNKQHVYRLTELGKTVALGAT